MRRLGRSLAATHPLLPSRRGATATTQLPYATLNYSSATLPRYPFCHIERSAAESKYLSIVGYSWVRFACWVLWVRPTAFVGYMGSVGSVGYTEDPHLTHLTHLTHYTHSVVNTVEEKNITKKPPPKRGHRY